MKLAILGGTFDPPHIGHLVLADILHHELGYEKILFIPSHIPAHKSIESGTNPAQRLEMVRIVTEDFQAALADDCEIKRGGTSYSIDTVRELKQRYGNITGKPGLLIGDDLLEGFSSWKESSQLMQETQIIIARRLLEKSNPPAFSHVYLDNPRILISSTDIRERVKEKRAFRYLVTEKIYSYIMNEHLYAF